MAGMRQSERFPHQHALEGMFGEDFSSVEVRTGQRTGLDALGANGMAMGETVAVADQTPTLDLMAHELSHVVQQRRHGTGNVNAASAFGDASEREARSAESRALSGQPIDVAARPTGLVAGDWSLGDLSVGSVLGGLAGAPLGPVGMALGAAAGNAVEDWIRGDDDAESQSAAEESPTEAAESPSQSASEASAPAESPAQPSREEREAARRRRVLARQRREARQHLESQGVEGEALEQRMAGFDIRANHVQHGVYDGTDEVVSLGDREAREAALNGLSQNHMATLVGDGELPEDEWQYMCGSTNLMAAVMMGGGNEGVGDLARSLGGYGDLDEHQREHFAEIAERAGHDQLTRMDLMELTTEMHREMRQFESMTGDPEARGVTGAALQDLGARNPVIERSMQAADIGLGQVDIEGDGVNNHWIMRMGEHRGAREQVYDPMAVHEGTQLRSDHDARQRYRTADASRL